MGENSDLHAPPGEQKIGMMAFLLGDFACAVDEVQSLFEIRKTKDAMKMMSLRRFPTRNLFEKLLHAFRAQLGNAALARQATFVG
jgi:hypothetical protein